MIHKLFNYLLVADKVLFGIMIKEANNSRYVLSEFIENQQIKPDVFVNYFIVQNTSPFHVSKKLRDVYFFILSSKHLKL